MTNATKSTTEYYGADVIAPRDELAAMVEELKRKDREFYFVSKIPVEKKAFPADKVPAELLETGAIEITPTGLILHSLECDEVVDFNPDDQPIIGWGTAIDEKTGEKQTESGYNTWVISNAATALTRKGDKFFMIPLPMIAERLVAGQTPVVIGDWDGFEAEGEGWGFDTSWGHPHCIPGDFIVRHGTKKDGTPQVYTIRPGAAGFENFQIRSESGEEGPLLMEVVDR